MHNVGTICIQNCNNPFTIACINNTANLAVGFNGFEDSHGSCWIPISDCPSCSPTVSFIGTIAQVWIGTDCGNCPGDSGTTPIEDGDTQPVSAVCKIKLRRCDEITGLCPPPDIGGCTYPLDGVWVTLQSPAIIPCPYLGQVVTVDVPALGPGPDDDCCYQVTDISDKAVSNTTVIITSVSEDCTDCCTGASPSNTPTATPTPTPTTPVISYARYRAVKCCYETQFLDVQAPVFSPAGSTFVIANECYEIVSTGGAGGPQVNPNPEQDCKECKLLFPC